MENIKNLNLTEKDFKMLVDGLDALPNAGRSGELLFDIMSETILKGHIGEDVKRKLDQQKKKIEHEKEMLTEDAKILQGKLLMLKRYLMENKLMEEVTSTLGGK